MAVVEALAVLHAPVALLLRQWRVLESI
jgi:hypothetical protein